MKFITVSELKQRATQVVSEIESTREEVIVTKNGKPIVLIQYVSENAFSLKTDGTYRVPQERMIVTEKTEKEGK